MDRGFTAEMVFYLDLETERVAELFKSSCRAVFLSTTLLPNKQMLKAATAAVRKFAPDAFIVCGGALVDRSWTIRKKLLEEKDELYAPCHSDHLFLGQDADDGCGADLFIITDPQLTVASDVLIAIKKGTRVKDIVSSLPNCATFSKGAWSFSSTCIANEPIVPAIRWSRFRKDEMRLTVPLIHSRGCPYRCKFCNFQRISGYIEKGQEDFRREVEELLQAHGDRVSTIHFCDDNFCGTRGTLDRFLETFIDMKSPLDWHSLFDARFIDGPLAEKLRASGCRLLKIGMESADDTILANIAKPCRVKDYQRAVKAMADNGISLDAYFIVGFPGETEDTAKRTVENINRFPVPTHSVNQLVLFGFLLAPLAPVYSRRQRDKYGLSGYMHQWKHNTMDSAKAQSLIPEMMRKITSMQPPYGNVEKMMVRNGHVLAHIDRARGELIRERLATGKENPVYWKEIEGLVAQLKSKPDPKSGSVVFE
jgi:hypothetical protein